MNLLWFRSHRREPPRCLGLLWIAVSALVWAQGPSAGRAAERNAGKELNLCQPYRVASLPGSHQFAADFIETIATDPSPRAKNSRSVWAVTADLSEKVSRHRRAIYVSRSNNDGMTWHPVARIDARYFDAKIGEGLRNGLAVFPGGRELVLTTQKGAFQIIPRRGSRGAIVKPIWGPRVPTVRPRVVIPKKTGDPVRAGIVKITADGQRMIVGYGYFDLNPRLLTYRRRHGSWFPDGRLPHLPTDLDIFSMDFDTPRRAHPRYLYVGTGDQAFRLDLRTHQWIEIQGVGADSAIHAMTTTAGLHLAACWGVYEPVNATTVERVIHASFLLHPKKDEAGSKIRAYDIAVDPLRPRREALAAITGIYVSRDRGQTWRRLNGLPDGEFHTAHFNPDGSILVSGMVGTFVVNPFSSACGPQLKLRTPLPIR